MKALDVTSLIAKPYGKLTILGSLGTKNNKTFVRCRCICGIIKDFRLSSLISGNTKSCGCLAKIRNVDVTKHGKSNKWLYNTWACMKNRCKNPNNPAFKHYGGRGISVCHEWGEYLPFMKWCLNNNYKKGLHIDRINNNGNYEPDNCRFVTQVENANNKRSNIYLKAYEYIFSPNQWSKILNIPPQHLRIRNRSLKWSQERTILTPLFPRGVKHATQLTYDQLTDKVIKWQKL